MCIRLMAVTVFAACATLAVPANADDLLPHTPAVKPARAVVQPWQDPGLVYVKIAEGRTVRVRNGALSDLGTGDLAAGAAAIAAVGGTWSPLHRIPEATLSTLRANA